MKSRDSFSCVRMFLIKNFNNWSGDFCSLWFRIVWLKLSDFLHYSGNLNGEVCKVNKLYIHCLTSTTTLIFSSSVVNSSRYNIHVKIMNYNQNFCWDSVAFYSSPSKLTNSRYIGKESYTDCSMMMQSVYWSDLYAWSIKLSVELACSFPSIIPTDQFPTFPWGFPSIL